MLLTADETARVLQVSVGQVYRLARTNRIPAHHLGASVRFNLEDVLASTASVPTPTRFPKTAAHRLALVRLQTRARRRTA